MDKQTPSTAEIVAHSRRCEAMANAIVGLAKYCHDITPIGINENGIFTIDNDMYVGFNGKEKLPAPGMPLCISFGVSGDTPDAIAERLHLMLREKMDRIDAPSYFVVKVDKMNIRVFIGPIMENPERMARVFQPSRLAQGIKKITEALSVLPSGNPQDDFAEHLARFERRIRHQIGAAPMADHGLSGKIVAG